MYTEKDIISKKNFRKYRNLIGKKVYSHDNMDELLEMANSEDTNCLLNDIDTRNGEYCFTIETGYELYKDTGLTTLYNKYIIVKKEN